jgi:hypothetical protein
MINSVQQLISFISATSKKPNTAQRIYRGQASNWPVLPKLYRPYETMSLEDIESLEIRLLSTFREEAYYLLPSVPNRECDLVSLAQHYGIPTRLTDWTTNPLMALFFAVVTTSPAKTPLIWIYDVTVTQRRDGDDFRKPVTEAELTTIVQPIHHSPRIAAQSGWQMIHLTYKEDAKQIRPLESMEFHKGRMTEIPIDPGAASALKNELKEMGIHHGTVYGDLSSACVGITIDAGFPSEFI